MIDPYNMTTKERLVALDTEQAEAVAKHMCRPFSDHRFGRSREHKPGVCCASMMVNYISYQCGKPTKVKYGSLEYCGVHNPRSILNRSIKQDEKYAYEAKLRKQSNDRKERQRQFESDCVNAVRQIAAGYNDARSLCQVIVEGYAYANDSE